MATLYEYGRRLCLPRLLDAAMLINRTEMTILSRYVILLIALDVAACRVTLRCL